MLYFKINAVDLIPDHDIFDSIEFQQLAPAWLQENFYKNRYGKQQAMLPVNFDAILVINHHMFGVVFPPKVSEKGSK